jgi:hypothetical protein
MVRNTRVRAMALVAAALLGSNCQRYRQDSSAEPPRPAMAQLGLEAPGVAKTSPSAATSPPAPAAPVLPACGEAGDTLVFTSPERPSKGRPVRIVVVTDRRVDAQLVLTAPDGAATTVRERQGGPPYAWITSVDAPAAGRWHVSLVRDGVCGGSEVTSQDIVVRRQRGPSPGTPRTALWFTRALWTPSLENLYSAWIEHLFDAPLDAQPSWNALHDVLRDRSRNFLYDHLETAEDDQNVVIRPDCADLPYFLRAYFAYKLGLPFGWSRCSRGENGVAPVCTDFATQSVPFPAPEGKEPDLPVWADPARTEGWESNIKRLAEFFRTTLADAVQSGAGRTPADDETGDYYPVALTAETLRPGTIFADPYGHVLVVAKRIAQTATSGGVLFAVDGQPDGTVARKRFWRGNFLFAIDPALGSAGFKRFRPIVRDTRAIVRDPKGPGQWRRLANRELPDYSLDQYAGGVEGFYDKVDDVLSPAPLDPEQALLETIAALEEQVKTRVTSVDNGRKFLASGKAAAEMPDGSKIFETNGDWEDFSTPSRDLRLLIAIDVARGFPARVARRPERYAMPADRQAADVRATLEARLARELVARRFRYVRSDGSDWELALDDVAHRESLLEMAYNPNDCVELRWGAAAGSPEASTCQAHAPAAQLAKMATYRSWFHDRKRPPR